MNISDLIKNKSARDQAWLEERRAERGNLSEMRDTALEEITTNPEAYQKYLDLQANNISCRECGPDPVTARRSHQDRDHQLLA